MHIKMAGGREEGRKSVDGEMNEWGTDNNENLCETFILECW